MTFGEKLREARLTLNLTQRELADMTGISERSLYTYEQSGIMPRSGNVRKLADALNVSTSYLLDEEETDPSKHLDQDIFLAQVQDEYGYRATIEAREVLTRASALFAGGTLSDEAKDAFFRSLMEVYLESKEEARTKFSPKSRAKRKSKN